MGYMRKLIIRFLSWLVKVEVKDNGEIVDIPQEVLFVSPDFTKEKFEASENIDEFINKIQ